MNPEFVNDFNKYLESCVFEQTNNCRHAVNRGDDVTVLTSGKAREVLIDAWNKFEELVSKDLEDESKKSITHISEFEVIRPDNPIEQAGEKLKLSAFGEYCPDNSLRGYSLYFLLSKPDNYRMSKIVQKGTSYILNQ